MSNYSEVMDSAKECIRIAEGAALCAVMNLATMGPLADLNSLCTEGNPISPSPGLFEDSGDERIDKLLWIIRDMENLRKEISANREDT
jgi:hypothetical protein